MYKKLHIIKDIMVLVLVVLEAIFLSIEDIPLNTADKAKTIFILLESLFLFSHVSKLIDDDSANDLADNELNDEKVDKVYNYICEGSIDKSINVAVCTCDHACILFEALV